MSSSLPAIDAQSENYRQAVQDLLVVYGSEPLFDLPESQLALSTLDGLTEVLEWNNQGQAADEIACIWLASLRWYTRTGNLLTSSHPYSLTRPLGTTMPTHAGRAADPATMSGLAHSDMQLIDRNLQAQEFGAGAMLRVLPISLLPVDEDQTVAVIAAKAAALTHGSAQSIGAAAVTAVLARATLAFQGTTEEPLTAALEYTTNWASRISENTGIPGDGADIEAALRGQPLEQDDAAEGDKTAIAVLAELAQSLRLFEADGTKLSPAEDGSAKITYGLWAAIVSLAGYAEDLKLDALESAQEALELLKNQWFKELGIS